MIALCQRLRRTGVYRGAKICKLQILTLAGAIALAAAPPFGTALAQTADHAWPGD
jgi:hypothetical protein